MLTFHNESQSPSKALKPVVWKGKTTCRAQFYDVTAIIYLH